MPTSLHEVPTISIDCGAISATVLAISRRTSKDDNYFELKVYFCTLYSRDSRKQVIFTASYIITRARVNVNTQWLT